MNEALATIEQFKQSLPDFIHTLPEKNKPAIWLPREHALRHERIRCYANDRHYLMLDYDNPTGRMEDHTRYDIEPNFLVYNPANFNHQAFWLLSDPVHCQQESKNRKPYQLLRAIESAFDDKYDGDHRFARYISRNPLFHAADTDWRHNRGHKLSELAEVVELNQQRIKTGSRTVIESAATGRNCTVFDDLRFWAYKQDTADMNFSTWLQRCTTQALQYNAFTQPLALKEVKSIAKSVAQYTFNKRFSESFSEYVNRTHTSDIQSERGKRSAEKRWANHVKQEPWVSLGISRATWYRRKKRK